MPTLFVATTNPGKLRELKQIFERAGVRVTSPNEAEIWREVAETGETFADNALLKARAFHEALLEEARREGWWVLGDDSGLEVDAMDGAPGVHSNRWAGPGTTASTRNERLLERLEGVPDESRGARFRCVMALIAPDGTEHFVDGAVEGSIARDLKGDGGFGYDPLFLTEDGRRMSELSPDEKNAISHRGVAAAKAARLIADLTR
jgi:XTP/dITP diphosphohydrolase